MDSQPYNPQLDWRGCITARLVPLDTITNVDTTGIMVCVAAVVTNFCLRIQIGWFDKTVDEQVVAAIIQTYCILIPALLSIGRQELSIFDANYALTVTASPFTIQLLFSSILDALGFETTLFGQIESRRRIIYFCVAVFLALWLALRLTLQLSSKAFIDSELCNNSTLKDQFVDLLSLFVPATGPTGGFWAALLGFLLAVITAEFYEVVASVLIGWEGARGPLQRFSDIWAGTKDAWNADFETQKRIEIFFAAIVDSYWASNLIYSACTASKGGYKVSFGQLLALFTTLPPLVSTINYIDGHREIIPIPSKFSVLLFTYLLVFGIYISFLFTMFVDDLVNNPPVSSN